MARPTRQAHRVTQIVGMNITDPEISLLPGQVRLIENVDLIQGGLGEKRTGFEDGPGGGTAPQGIASAEIVALFRHVPDGEDSTAELWAVVRPTTPGTVTLRRYVGGVWSTIPLTDSASWADGETWSFATFNRKLFIAYKTLLPLNRLHVWDGATVRRVGLGPPFVAPALATIGPGALNFTRHYRVRFTASPGAPSTTLISDPGPTASITVAASAGVRISRPFLNDGIEQAWQIEAANSVNGPFFVIAQVPIGTLTFDDTNATVPTTFPATEAGIYTLPPSAKYLAVYQNQLIMAGAWETTLVTGGSVPKNNRVWYTRPLGSLEIGDDESITTTLTQKFYTDTGEDNDRINGLSYPVNGVCYVTKRRQFWALIPRDSDVSPFAAVRLTDAVGCRDFRTIVIGEDESGDPALYWNSLRGPYRLVRGGMQYLGRDLEVGQQLAQVDRAVWVAHLRQVWWTNSAGGLFFYVFHVRFGRAAENGDIRNGWTQHDANDFGPRTPSALCVFGQLFQAADEVLLPVVGGATLLSTSYLWQYSLSASTDVGFPYQGRILSGQLTFGELLYNVSVYPPRVYAAPASGVSVTLEWRLWRNFESFLGGSLVQVSTALFDSGPGFENFHRIATFEGISQSDGEVYQYQIGDAAPGAQRWRILAALIPYQRQEEAE